MHFEVLVEDASGKKMLESLFPLVVGEAHTFSIHSYKGIGRVPKNMRDSRNAEKRILLDNLPKLLKGYGRTFSGYVGYNAAVVVVCDLDDKCLVDFKNELEQILHRCEIEPEARFCFAVEEGEAWLLGDIAAVKVAYPHAKNSVLNSYENDSICGTWEVLADAIYSGGAASLSQKHWTEIGREKYTWAERISPRMTIENNNSPSFRYFCDSLEELCNLE